MTLEELYDRALVLASMRQARFTAQIADRIWWVDPQNCRAQLYTRERKPASEMMPIRILGTEAEGEWLWVWGNALNFPLPWTRDYSKKLCDAFAELGITEFGAPRIAVDGVANAQTFAIIAAAQADTAGYVLHRAGPITAAFVVGEPFVTPDATDLETLAKAIGYVLGGGFRPYAKAQDVIVGVLEMLDIEFDRHSGGVVARDELGGILEVGVENGRFDCKFRRRGN